MHVVRDQAEDEAAIRKCDEAYVEAYNNYDAKALAAMWSPEAVYVDPETGEEAVGREEIEKEFAETFEGVKDAKLEIDVEAIKFLSPNVAVESGTARILRPKEEPDESTYSAPFVKRDGNWLLDRVTEDQPPAPPAPPQVPNSRPYRVIKSSCSIGADTCQIRTTPFSNRRSTAGTGSSRGRGGRDLALVMLLACFDIHRLGRVA